MTITFSNRIIRSSAAAALAAIGLFGLAACSGSTPEPEKEPSTSASAEAETETETTEEAPSSDGNKCSEEQFATLNSMSGAAIPAETLAAADASFSPAALIGDLPATCLLSFESPAGKSSYAVLSGGAATLSAVAANATAAGGQATETAGTLTGSLEGLTIVGMPLTQLTQETAGFENAEDLVVVIATGLLG